MKSRINKPKYPIDKANINQDKLEKQYSSYSIHGSENDVLQMEFNRLPQLLHSDHTEHQRYRIINAFNQPMTDWRHYDEDGVGFFGPLTAGTYSVQVEAVENEALHMNAIKDKSHIYSVPIDINVIKNDNESNIKNHDQATNKVPAYPNDHSSTISIIQQELNQILYDYQATEQPEETCPDEFDFGPNIISTKLNTWHESPKIKITGIDIPIPIVPTEAEYSLNNAEWTKAVSIANENDEIVIRVRSAGQYNQTVTGNINIGGYSRDFSVLTTKE